LYSTYQYITLRTRSVSAMPTNKKNHAVGVAISYPPLKNRWQALRAATEKAARQGDRFRFNSDLVRFYAEVRTDFRENP